MHTLPPPARPDNSAAPPTPSYPHRVADAHRRLHESQTDLAFGDPVSLRCDEAEAAYTDAVADATAERFAKIQDFVASLRLVAGDETGLREIVAHLIAEIVGILPQNTAEVLGDVVRFCKATRRELAALGVEELDSQTRITAGEIRTRAVEAQQAAIVAALAARGIEVAS